MERTPSPPSPKKQLNAPAQGTDISPVVTSLKGQVEAGPVVELQALAPEAYLALADGVVNGIRISAFSLARGLIDGRLNSGHDRGGERGAPAPGPYDGAPEHPPPSEMQNT